MDMAQEALSARAREGAIIDSDDDNLYDKSFVLHSFTAFGAQAAREACLQVASGIAGFTSAVPSSDVETETYATYADRMRKNPSSLNWGGHTEFKLFSWHLERLLNVKVDFRLIHLKSISDCVFAMQPTQSTLDVACAATAVVFCVLKQGHYSMYGAQSVEGSQKFIFTLEEAPEAERGIREFLCFELGKVHPTTQPAAGRDYQQLSDSESPSSPKTRPQNDVCACVHVCVCVCAQPMFLSLGDSDFGL
jgi:hypothetical protein